MSEFNIEVQGGSSVRLPTAGKYCDRDIIVTASGGGGTEEIENIIDQSGVLGTTDETVTVTEKVEQLIDKAEDENIWYQISAEVTKGIDISKTTIEVLPKLSYANVENLAYAFKCETLKRAPHYINCEKCTSLSNAFAYNPLLEYIEGIYAGKATTVGGLLRNCPMLHTVNQPLDFSSATNIGNFCIGSGAIVKISFAPETIKVSFAISSPVLSIGNVFNLNDTENVGSVQSIINGLVTLAEGAAAQTLTLSKNLPLTEEQKQAITTAVNNKGWTLAFA